MKHLHHATIDSTSAYLKSHYKDLLKEGPESQDILISCDKQTAGRGRSGNQWEQPTNSLAFSFTLKPCSEMTLSSLELGVLLAQFFEKKIQLKWPNDMLTPQHEKCGGILCQLVEQKLLIVGIGLNLGKFDSSRYDFPYPIGAIEPKRELKKEEFETLPKEIYQYILSNRLSPEEIVGQWNQLCIHLNGKVSIVDGDQKTEGVFKGIDRQGAALLESNGEIQKVMSGSLFFNK